MAEFKVFVIIPVYDETIETVLMPLRSLLNQQGVRPKQFEVVVIVSNSKQEAQKRTKAFLQNQKVIRFLKTLSLEKIKIHILDKSSLKQANTFENANSARDFAGRWVIEKDPNCILAFTDCDCEFSKNYIKELILTFKNKNVHRVAGKLLFHAQQGEKKQLFELASQVHFGRDRLHKNFQLPKKHQALIFYKPTDKKRLNIAGQNLAVTSKAFLEVGGIGKFRSFDDMLFAKRVDRLGLSVLNSNFYITTLFRPSTRGGLVGLGQRVMHFEQSLSKFLKGESKVIHVLDFPATQKVTEVVLKFVIKGKQDMEELKKEVKKMGSDFSKVAEKDLLKLFKLLKLELTGQSTKHDSINLEKLVLKKFYHLLPVKVIK